MSFRGMKIFIVGSKWSRSWCFENLRKLNFWASAQAQAIHRSALGWFCRFLTGSLVVSKGHQCSALNLCKIALSDSFENFHPVYLLHGDFNDGMKKCLPF